MILLVVINTEYGLLGNNHLDIYLYLIQALEFSGNNIVGNNYYYINNLSPLIPFLTSLFFRLGFISETAIFIVTGIFYCFGVLGIYLLLKLRFNELCSIFGAILWGSLSIVLIWAASGSLDIPSVTLTLFSLYFTILASEKNQKFFYLALPLAVLAFFAKYTAGLVFPLIILYLLSKPDIICNIKKYLKNFIGGSLIGLTTAIPFIYYYISIGSLGFVSQAQEIAESSQINISNDIFFYFINIPLFIANPKEIFPWIIPDLILSLIIILIAVYGLIYSFKKLFNFMKEYYKIHILVKNKSFLGSVRNNSVRKNNKLFLILFIVNILTFVIIFLTVGQISFIFSELLIFISFFTFALLFNHILKSMSEENNKKNYKYFSYDLLMCVWFISYMVFFSAHLVKVNRYFICMTPIFVFFVVLGMKYLMKDWKIKYKRFIIPLMLISLMFFSLGQLTISKNSDFVDNANDVVSWLKKHDPNYENKIIFSDRGEIFTWLFKKEVYYVKDPYLSSESATQNLIKKLNENNATYFISRYNNLELEGFQEIMSNEKFSIYERK